MALDMISLPCLSRAKLETRQAMQTYVDFLKIDRIEELNDILHTGEAWKKWLDTQTPVSTTTVYNWARALEAYAVSRGSRYDLRLGGIWLVNTETLADVLKMCGIELTKDILSYNLRQKFGKPKFTCYGHVLQALCNMTGSLPEELAEKLEG